MTSKLTLTSHWHYEYTALEIHTDSDEHDRHGVKQSYTNKTTNTVTITAADNYTITENDNDPQNFRKCITKFKTRERLPASELSRNTVGDLAPVK